MPLSPPRLLALLLGFALTPAQGARAGEAFEISLGGDRLGRVTHSTQGGTRDLALTLDSTPFGVFDGSYAGRSVSTGATTRHSGRTRSSRKSRDLSMTLEGGALREVAIAPPSEVTALTAPGAVAGVLDPVSGFGRLLEARACPDGLRIYDGRRVGLLSATGTRREGGGVVCEARYEVQQGPGYLEPLGISRLSVELGYDAAWRLDWIRARSGIFALRLER
ncbi:hypothetical protein [Limimaricola cinnabarinus]|uniref:hypothetical protein n=1 Tax=Limimaricola cinnabarinus TaxID=1125964 RepID=UPI002492671D|nr:hypothetical protein [Limimaricola cinnabarinus]